MKKLAFFCIILLPLLLRGKTPIGDCSDRLIIDGDTSYMRSDPLHVYFKSHKIVLDPPMIGDQHIMFLGLGRPHIGTWRITDGKLYLVRLENYFQEPIDIGALFGEKYQDGRVFADWVTDGLYAHYGDQVMFVEDIAKILKREKKITVEKGDVLSIDDYSTLTSENVNDPEMVRIWNGHKVENQEEIEKKLFDIVAANFKWDEYMTADMRIVVKYRINKDLTHSVEDTHPADDLIHVSYISGIKRILDPLKVESVLFRGRPIFPTNLYIPKFYFDAAQKRIYRLEEIRP